MIKSKKDFYGKIIDSVQEYTAQIVRAQRELEILEENKKSGKYDIGYISGEISKQKRLIEHLRQSGKDDVRRICGEYKQELTEEDFLKGSDLTDDARLLTAGIGLDKKDLAAMLSRNKGNRTMQQVVLRYAKEHNIDMGVEYVGNNQLISVLDSVPYVTDTVFKWAGEPTAYRDIYNKLMGEGSELARAFEE